MLYGTANGGGILGGGTVFRINTDGSGFTNLYNFSKAPFPVFTNSEGTDLRSGLALGGNTLYGVAASGGSGGSGTLFKLNTDGTAFTLLHSFTAVTSSDPYSNEDGAGPSGRLFLSGQKLYGTANVGGVYGNGNVFVLNTNGTGFTNLYDFSALQPFSPVNLDGANPAGGIILSGNFLYGATDGGGTGGNGALFALTTDGTGFTNLHSFPTNIVDGSGFHVNDDGIDPPGGLVLANNVLYGVAKDGGAFGNGTVFSIDADSSGFSVLHTFFRTPSNPPRTNSEGAVPYARLVMSGNMLYGTATDGGLYGKGTVFGIRTDGTGFTNFYDFTGGNDGAEPFGALVISDNIVYGTTFSGGSSGNGTIFSLVIGPKSPPRLTITALGNNVLLFWPINATNFNLQFTTNLAPPATWSNVIGGQGVLNGQNVVTNPLTGTRKFYRLIQ
jgi:uncharacterized repeat protein (TIGR03803 family)